MALLVYSLYSSWKEIVSKMGDSYNRNVSSSIAFGGYGVTNYNVDKPSFGYTADPASTEFHGELLRRNIINPVQGLMSKGMSENEANRLLSEQKQQRCQEEIAASIASEIVSRSIGNNNDDHDDESTDYDDDDESLMDRYRQERFATMQNNQRHQSITDECSQGDDKNDFRKHSNTSYNSNNGNNRAHIHNSKTFYGGEAVYISRNQWIEEVNDASYSNWVIVCFTDDDMCRNISSSTAFVTDMIRSYLAIKYCQTKFVLINYQDAVPNFPQSNLPSIFAYRYGAMKHERIGMNDWIQQCNSSNSNTRTKYYSNNCYNNSSNNSSKYEDHPLEVMLVRDWNVLF